MPKIYLSLGSNHGWKKKRLKKAISEIGKIGSVLKTSSFFHTKPYGKTDQPDFLNCAIVIETSLSPEALLDEIHIIEERLGRVRAEKWGPRKIDIDIIFYDDLILDTSVLKIPHPDMQNRDFVLKPLMDICPDFVHPVLRKSIRALRQAQGPDDELGTGKR